MDLNRPQLSRSRLPHAVVALLVVASMLSPVWDTAQASETVTQTFSYTGSVQTFTVPDGVSTLTVSLAGGQGGRGGGDSQGSPTPGGYRGVVSGTIEVTPGQEITVAVGSGGANGVSSRGSAPGGTGGQNPLAGYDGGRGGMAGPAGSSGGGGGGGAATVLRIDDTDIVAAGAGGNGGNGQFLPIVGRRAEEEHRARPDATSTDGRRGKDTTEACTEGYRCDGGASGAGGAGAQGGERGDVQYGGASATEYFGFGGYPGSNDTAGLAGLSALYEYFAGNGAHGSVTITYDDGAPGAPRSVTGTPAPGRVDVGWQAPIASGAGPVTDYVVEYATSVEGPWSTVDDGESEATTVTVDGLEDGTGYWFRVRAVNAFGTSAPSAPMAEAVVPSDVPEAPRIDAVTPVDAGLRLSVTPGATDSPLTGWEYRLDGGTWRAATEAEGTVTIGGLTNGTAYVVELRARNAIGPSDASAPAEGTPRSVPGAPTALTATAGDGSIELAWSAPGSDNGAAVTDYVVQYGATSEGPFATHPDGEGTATTAVLDGLDNGTTYHVRVAAVNAAGTGPASALAAATPYTTPAAPTIAALSGADGSLVVDLDPVDDGGAALLRHEYRLDGGPWRSTGATADPFTVTGLANGTTYQVEVRSVNAAGAGPASAPAAAAPRSAPSAPAISAVALDTGAVQVSFTLGSDGGSPVTNVEYSTDGGDTWTPRSPASPASPISISGLVGGETYDVRLRAVNAVGAGAPSNRSTVTAKGTPEAPTITSVTPGDRTLRVSVAAGPNGGSAITNYEYSTDDGGTWTTRSPASTASPVVLDGLTNGTTYQVRVRAVNAAGSGAALSATSATPRTTPGAPTIESDTVSGVGGQLDVEFAAPADDGGAAITGYQYSTDAGATWRDRDAGSTASPLRITTLSVDGTTPLVGGRTYPVEIRAVNAAGPGAASAVADGITTTAPDAPVIDEVDVSDAAARIGFTRPANGGSAITRYEYRVDGSAWTDTGSLSGEVTIGGLSNAGTYTVEVRAVNGVGAGPASAPRDVRVSTTPAAPDVSAVDTGDGALVVTFTPGDDGGDAVTGYEYSTDGGVTWRTVAGTSSPLTLTADSDGEPLVNGVLYAVQIRARNAQGAGAASVSTLVAPQGPPAAPVGVTLTPGDGALTVEADDLADGGSSITGLQYRLDGGAWTDAGSLDVPFTIAGLVNGTPRQVELRALNAVGAGAPSAPVTGTPATVPSAPRSLAATVEDGATTLSWAAPAVDGGAPVTGYLATLFDAPTGGLPVASCATDGATTCTVDGLDNGTTYYAAALATNDAGPGSVSTPRVAVTPLGRPVVTVAAIEPGAGQLRVDVDTVANGAPVITYEYRLDDGEWTSTASAAEPFTIPGLVTGVAYSLQVRAVSSAGTGDPTAPVEATPRTLPAAPGDLVAEGGDGAITLTWDAPGDDGGAAVTDYVVRYATSAAGPFTTADDGVSPATAATVDGLTNGTEYVVRVAAVNAAGTGPSTPLVAATPLAAPDAPTLTSLTVGSRYLQAAFTAPADDGGAPVTGYEYRLDDGEWRTASGSSSPITIAGLTNGQSYTVALRAVNEVGGGAASDTRSATPYGLPDAVTGFTASPMGNSVVLDWDPVDANGSPVSRYDVIRWSARTEGSIAQSLNTSSTSLTVGGLAPGTYWFTIEATNAAGTGPRSSPRTSGIVGGTVPAAPSVDQVVVDGDDLTIGWTPGAAGSSTIDGYLLRRVVDGERTTLVDATAAATSTTVELPSGDGPYELQLALRSAAGIGATTTIRPPVSGGVDVDDVTQDGASLVATANANDRATTLAFEVATDADDLGTPDATVVAASPGSSDGTDTTAVSASLDGLAPGTTHHVRLRAVSDDGTTYGPVATFRTTASVTTTGLAVTYDGGPVDLTTVTEPAGLAVERTFEGVDGTSYGPTDAPPSGAGTYRVTTRVVADGHDGVEVAELTIAPRDLEAQVTAIGRAWNGTTGVDLEVALDGVVDGDDVEVGDLSGRLADAGAGEDRTVAVEVSGDPLVGSDADNYRVDLPSETTVTIRRAAQALAIEDRPAGPLRVGDSWSPVVRSDRGLPVTLSVVSAEPRGSDLACTLSEGVLRAVAEGACVLVATQPGTSDVAPAEPVAHVVSVIAAPEPPTTPGPPAGRPPAGGPSTGRPGGVPGGGSTGTGPGTGFPWAGLPGLGAGLPADGAGPGAGRAATGAGSGLDDNAGDADSSQAGAEDASSLGRPPGSAAAGGGTGLDGLDPPQAGADAAADGGSGSGSDASASPADEAGGLGDEVAGVSQERSIAGRLVGTVTDRPMLSVLVLVLVVSVAAWLLGGRRRRGDTSEA